MDTIESRYLDDGCDELLEEAVFQKVGPVVVDEVDEETFNVRPVLILICHDHHFPIPQSLHCFYSLVLLFVPQTKNLDQVVDFGILHNL